MKQDLNGTRTAQDIERKYDLASIAKTKKAAQQSEKALIKIEQETNNLLSSLIINLGGIVEQAISLWFYSGVPTLENSPANVWITDELKNEHLNDLYYDRETGYVYKFVEGYKWEKQLDGQLVESMALTNASIDTSDHERQIFFEETPTPPYNNGDWYINKNGDLYICQISKDSTETYNENDFIISSQYTYNTNAENKGNLLTVISGRITKVEVGVDKLNSTMEETLNDVTVAQTQINQNTNEINLLAEKVVDLDNTVSGTGSIQLTSCNEGIIHYLNIQGEMSLSFPSETTYPSTTAYPMSGTVVVTNSKGAFEYTIPLNYLNVYNGVSDELRITEGKVTVLRNIVVDSDGNKSIATNPITETYEDAYIHLANGTNTLSLKGFPDAKLTATYLLENIYTDSFATKADVESAIKVAGGEIDLLVQQRISGDAIISQINLDATGAVKINASKAINLNGYVSNDAGNFEITPDGKAKFREAEITGGNIYLPSGGMVIGGDGMLTNLVYTGYTRGRFVVGSGDYIPLGRVGGGETAADQINELVFAIDLPDNFTVVDAKICLSHAPITWRNYDSSLNITGNARNLKLYKASNIDNLKIYMNIETFVYDTTGTDYTEVLDTNSVNILGSNGYTGSKTVTTYITNNIPTNYFNATNVNYFVVRDSDNAFYDTNEEIFGRSGGMFGYIEIIGYMPYTK